MLDSSERTCAGLTGSNVQLLPYPLVVGFSPTILVRI
jgi:hypothetical protein